ncbi:MAG: hypothetical protein J0L55_16800, partial [Caulobacterales bacterium]|nr:hypothetical protein [Caulobacterales bacterium]
MINALTPYRAPIVPNRDKVEPVQAVARVEMNPYHSKANYERANNSKNYYNPRPKLNTQNFSPYFAVHVLMEA